MPTATWTITTKRSPEEAFAYITDFFRHHEWSKKPYEVKAMTEGPLQVGSKFHSVGFIPMKPKNENDVEITRVEAPRRLSWTSYDNGQPFTTDWELTPVDGGTRIDRTINMPSPGGFQGLLFPMFFPLYVKPAIQKGQNMLRDRLDAGA